MWEHLEKLFYLFVMACLAMLVYIETQGYSETWKLLRCEKDGEKDPFEEETPYEKLLNENQRLKDENEYLRKDRYELMELMCKGKEKKPYGGVKIEVIDLPKNKEKGK